MYRLVILLFTLLFLVPAGVLADDPPRTSRQRSIVLLTGSGKDNSFWELFVGFMRASAADFGIRVEVEYANNSRNQMISNTRRVCRRANKPDAIVAQSFKKVGPKILQLAERHQVPVVLVNSGLTEEETKSVGEPRTNLEFWIGQMLPDDYGAGYKLANALIDEARKDPRRIAPDGKVHLIGINGVVSHGASIQRVAGLRDAVAERRNEAILEQVVAADWAKDLAHSRCRILHRRYPESSAIWTASDHMAEGVIDAMRERGLTPGKDVVIGGVDATSEAMDLIQQGTLCATVGGHFMEGGWVVVLLHDYFQLGEAHIPVRYDSPMTLVTENNLATYRSLLTDDVWRRTDFRQFSRSGVSGKGDYRFDPDTLATESVSNDVSISKSNRGEDSRVNDADDK